MNREKFEKRLMEKYPLLYRDMYGDVHQTCMAFGIEVNKGWWPLVEDLSAKIEPKIQNIKEELEKNPNLKCEVCRKGKKWHWWFSLVAIFTCFFRNLKRWPKCAWKQYKYNQRWRKCGEKYDIKKWSIFRGAFRFPKWHKPCRKFRVPFPCAVQIKEKFGELRVYMSYYNEEIEKFINEAEELSRKTCERCGAPGEQKGGGWIVTLCDECDKKTK